MLSLRPTVQALPSLSSRGLVVTSGNSMCNSRYSGAPPRLGIDHLEKIVQGRCSRVGDTRRTPYSSRKKAVLSQRRLLPRDGRCKIRGGGDSWSRLCCMHFTQSIRRSHADGGRDWRRQGGGFPTVPRLRASRQNTLAPPACGRRGRHARSAWPRPTLGHFSEVARHEPCTQHTC